MTQKLQPLLNCDSQLSMTTRPGSVRKRRPEFSHLYTLMMLFSSWSRRSHPDINPHSLAPREASCVDGPAGHPSGRPDNTMTPFLLVPTASHGVAVASWRRPFTAVRPAIVALGSYVLCAYKGAWPLPVNLSSPSPTTAPMK
jgi:hypothetical protein